MNTLKKTAAGSVLGGALMVTAGLGLQGLAHAAPAVPDAQPIGDGKVNVTVTAANGQQIGVLQDVTLANGLTLVNAVCPVSGITEANLNDLDLNGTAITQTCGGMGGLSFTFSQNGPAGPGASQSAPGHNRTTSTIPPSANPSVPPGQQR